MFKVQALGPVPVSLFTVRVVRRQAVNLVRVVRFQIRARLGFKSLREYHVSLDKGIEHGKEHRKPYHGSKKFDPACRNNTCPWCLSNKLHQQRKELEKAQVEDEFDHS